MKEQEIDDIIKICEVERIRKYLLRYIDELQRHFEIEQEDLEGILFDCYKAVKKPNCIKKLFNMVKLFNRL